MNSGLFGFNPKNCRLVSGEVVINATGFEVPAEFVQRDRRKNRLVGWVWFIDDWYTYLRLSICLVKSHMDIDNMRKRMMYSTVNQSLIKIQF